MKPAQVVTIDRVVLRGVANAPHERAALAARIEGAVADRVAQTAPRGAVALAETVTSAIATATGGSRV